MNKNKIILALFVLFLIGLSISNIYISITAIRRASEVTVRDTMFYIIRERDTIIYNITQKDSIIKTIKKEIKEDETDILNLTDGSTIKLFYKYTKSE